MNSFLVVGGTGTFGKAMVRRLLDTDAEVIRVFSRCEYKQSIMKREVGNDSRLRFFIGDVRDSERLKRAMWGVDVVFHAAALKRVDACEYDPEECVKTNVIGSMNVIEAAIDCGVQKVVALSTDKAAEPINTYGASKMLLERMFLAIGQSRQMLRPLMTVTRYGNIIGSTGSVLPVWRKMISDGHTSVPVTDPEATRFFMTIDQAVELVYAAAFTETSGDLVIPELPAYRLGDLAEALNVGMHIIGMPATEKLHEVMIPGRPSCAARRMTIEELREAIRNV